MCRAHSAAVRRNVLRKCINYASLNQSVSGNDAGLVFARLYNSFESLALAGFSELSAALRALSISILFVELIFVPPFLYISKTLICSPKHTGFPMRAVCSAHTISDFIIHNPGLNDKHFFSFCA